MSTLKTVDIKKHSVTRGRQIVGTSAPVDNRQTPMTVDFGKHTTMPVDVVKHASIPVDSMHEDISTRTTLFFPSSTTHPGWAPVQGETHVNTQLLDKVLRAATLFYLTRGVCWLHRLPENLLKEIGEGCEIVLERVDELSEQADMLTAVMTWFLAVNCELILVYLEAKDYLAEKWEQLCDKTGEPGWLVPPRADLLQNNSP